MGPKQKLCFFHAAGPVVYLGFSYSSSQDELTLSSPHLPKIEEAVAPSHISHPASNSHDPKPLRVTDTQGA